MAKGGHLGFENGFQIWNGKNAQSMDSHRKVIIDLSVEMALEKPDKLARYQIYDTYPAMVSHLFGERGDYGKLDIWKAEQLKDAKYEGFGVAQKLREFRYDRFGTMAHTYLPFGEGKEIKLSEVMPCKPVRLPA